MALSNKELMNTGLAASQKGHDAYLFVGQVPSLPLGQSCYKRLDLYLSKSSSRHCHVVSQPLITRGCKVIARVTMLDGFNGLFFRIFEMNNFVLLLLYLK